VVDTCGAATVTGPACIGNAIGPVDVLVEDGGPTANRRWALSRNSGSIPAGAAGSWWKRFTQGIRGTAPADCVASEPSSKYAST